MLVRLALAPLLGAAQVPAPPEVALEWRAPAGCPEREEVLAAIARRLGRPLTAEEAEVEATVVRESGRGFTLRLRLTAGERGETRAISDPSCAALADVVAVLVAAAVEPARVPAPAPTTAPEPGEPGTAASSPGPAAAAASPPEPAPEPASSPEPAPVDEPLAEPLAPPPEPVPSRRSKKPGGFVRVHGGGEVGAAPRITGAVGVAGGVLWPRWRLEVQGLFVAPQATAREVAGMSVEVRAGLFAAAVHGCARLGRGALEVPLCVGLEAGAMRGEARGLASGRAAAQGWLAGVLGAGVVWHAGARWGVWGAVQAVLSPVHPKFELDAVPDPVRLWAPSWASGRLMLGVELRFGDPW
ncbi:hypothetical protein SAMN02745121_04329 [Nannocystis exedens]|uniref:Uncharacterized protein n=1 Tax=Nannocystis exedens TaxID=54 RepID=A0A1I2ARE1_9BACT|nr:hypothetical protein [Nannocystis exedens]PCC74226.1 hypothetical protein NAEX_07315 [Nannocystis exedens]SFE46462.1 hypothetical protein SAMN02745121_04329 [Nannocystis exedens]